MLRAAFLKATKAHIRNLKKEGVWDLLVIIICNLNNFRFEEMKTGNLTFDQKSKLVGEEWRDQNMPTRNKKVNTKILY